MIDYIKYKELTLELLEELEAPVNELKGVNCFFPIFEKMRQDRAVVIIAMGLDRANELYSLSVLGGLLKRDSENRTGSIRLETSELEGGLAYICASYAEEAWGWQGYGSTIETLSLSLRPARSKAEPKYEPYKKAVTIIAGYNSEADGIDRYLPILEKISREGCPSMIKLDYERIKDFYTLLIRGGPFQFEDRLPGGKIIYTPGCERADTADLEGGLSYICMRYAEEAWGYKVVSKNKELQ